MSNFLIGRIAEFQAIFFLLILKLYIPIKIRFKTKYGEIDLICFHLIKRKIAFIEVKSRKSKEQIFESISNHQINRILAASEFFLKKYQEYSNHQIEIYAVFFHNLYFKKIFKIYI